MSFSRRKFIFSISSGLSWILTSFHERALGQISGLPGFWRPKIAQAATVTYHETRTINASSGNQTFSAMNIGTPATDRTVIVVVFNNDSRSSNPTAVTVGGITATKSAEASQSGGTCVQFWTASLASGTTANVVVTVVGTAESFGVSTFSATGLQSVTPQSNVSSFTAPGSTAITIPADGFAISAAMSGGASGGPTATWANAVERFDGIGSSGTNNRMSGAVSSVSGATTITCTWTNTTSGGRAMLTSAWR